MKKMAGLIVVILIILISVSAYRKQDMLQMQEGIAKQVIRFHVRANSDTDSDQTLKLKVKDAVITYLAPKLAKSKNLEETRQILNENLNAIHDVSVNTLEENKSDYPVNVYFENSYFPMKTYGDITLPPGNYEAFRIDIGDRAGKNWWCVLYPPLCFVDATHGTLPDESKQQLKNILTQDEYRAVSETGQTVSIRFKYLTFLNQFFK